MITPATYDLSCFHEIPATQLKVGHWVLWNQREKEDIAEAVRVGSPVTNEDKQIKFFIDVTTGRAYSNTGKSEVFYVNLTAPQPYATIYIYADHDEKILALKPEFEPR